MDNKRAELLLRQRLQIDEVSFVEMVVWRVPQPLRGSNHFLKYRLAFVRDGHCLLRYDNEAGKGDHRHRDGIEEPIQFKDSAALIAAFWRDVETYRRS